MPTMPGQGSFAPTQQRAAMPPPGSPQAVCMNFPALREEVEKGAAQIKAAADRKASREEVCPLFKSFAIKEARMVKFLETNRVACGVPREAITQVKGSQANTIRIRNQVCSNAPGAAAAAGPSLSDALGGPIIADDTNANKRGIFDTLTGNALSR
jgi:hypothetical protein